MKKNIIGTLITAGLALAMVITPVYAQEGSSESTSVESSSEAGSDSSSESTETSSEESAAEETTESSEEVTTEETATEETVETTTETDIENTAAPDEETTAAETQEAEKSEEKIADEIYTIIEDNEVPIADELKVLDEAALIENTVSPEPVTLKIIHKLVLTEEELIYEEILEGYKIGDIISTAEHSKADDMVSLTSAEENVELKDGENTIVMEYGFKN